MVMIWSAADDGIDVFLVQALSPILVFFRSRKFLSSGCQGFLIDIAERHNVFVMKHIPVSSGTAPATNKRDVEFVSRAILTKKRPAWEDQKTGASSGSGG